MALISSLDAHKYLRASLTACSWKAGWRSLLLRAYDDPTEANEFVTPATRDLLIVLVTGGACDVEVRYRGGWQRSRSEVGHIGMTAPGEAAMLRWRGDTTHSTLQLHLPAETLDRVAQDLPQRRQTGPVLPSGLGTVDPLVSQVMLSLDRAFRAGAPDLYAETAAEMLAAHLLVRHGRFDTQPQTCGNSGRLRQVDAFMRDNLAASVSLEMLAQEAGVSRFHLLRLYKKHFGQTPLRRLTELRMEEAKRLLKHGDEPVTAIAAKCGYDNPSHFATAFRRVVGVSPAAYRR
ncbi:helix-turn-helix domain-containing protein [Bradyrhizobium sp. ma5]|uniref:helix-turn-helix domain-containing protein n=1 Tax=Bradyrhizobium sp. ma5 TaxID=3344828 RepID=UPI0035D47F35